MMSYFNELFADPIALIGVAASVIVLISMCFNSTTRQGSIYMRATNLLGSIVSVIYGTLLGPHGAGMILLNGVLVFVNLYYLTVTLKHK